MKRATLLLTTVAALALGLTGCPDRAATKASPAEPSRDSLTLDPSSPQRNFIKIEEV